jgi:hypothetical protein
MTKRRKSTRNLRPEFRVVARASLDYFIAEQERLAQAQRTEQLDADTPEEDPEADHDE